MSDLNNRKRIFNLVYKNNEPISRSIIAQTLGLSAPTVVNNINQLINEGLFEDGEMLDSTGGRKATAITYNRNACFSVGVDITPAHFSVVISDMSGQSLCGKVVDVPFEETPQYNSLLDDTVRELIESSDIDKDKLLGTTFSLPGVVTIDKKILLVAHILNLSAYPASVFEYRLPSPVYFVNASNAAAQAEIWHQPYTNAVYLSISSTVGGAYIIDQAIYEGKTMRAGEFGHMALYPGGKQCYCGAKGCADAYISTNHLTALTNGDLEKFFQSLDKNDKKCASVWKEYTKNLAQHLSNLLSAWDDTLIIGGQLGKYIDKYIPDLQQMVGLITPFPGIENHIVACAHKENAAAHGASLLLIKEFLDNI